MNVLITADDYGLHPSVNQGIEELAASGQLDGVSVMAHRDADWSSLDALRRSGIPLGVHLVFVQERPLTSGRGLRALLDGERFPSSYRALFRRVMLRPGVVGALVEEAAAQVERLRAAGVEPAFVNSHEHVHLFPPIWSALHALLDSAGWRVRAVPRPRWPAPLKQLAVDMAGTLCWARAPLRRAGVLRPVGIELAGRTSAQGVAPIARRYAHDDFPLELVTHPGRSSPGLRDRYGHWRYHWDEELAALQGGEIRRALRREEET